MLDTAHCSENTCLKHKPAFECCAWSEMEALGTILGNLGTVELTLARMWKEKKNCLTFCLGAHTQGN